MGVNESYESMLSESVNTWRKGPSNSSFLHLKAHIARQLKLNAFMKAKILLQDTFLIRGSSPVFITRLYSSPI